jgi:hypothetical protein
MPLPSYGVAGDAADRMTPTAIYIGIDLPFQCAAKVFRGTISPKGGRCAPAPQDCFPTRVKDHGTTVTIATRDMADAHQGDAPLGAPCVHEIDTVVRAVLIALGKGKARA